MTRSVLIQVGDLHLGADWVAIDPLDTLTATIDAVLALELEVAGVLALGDITQHGADAEYAAARAQLERLEAPVFAAMGNHDERAALRRGFGIEPAGALPVRYSADVGPVRLVVCDTTIPGQAPGRLGPEDLTWLDDQLGAAPVVPTVLAMHHPPLLTRTPAWDQYVLDPSVFEPLAQILDRHPQVGLITAAHLHRPLTASFAGRPLMVAASTYVQFPLSLTATDLDSPSPEGPGYIAHVIADEGVLLSSQETLARPGGGAAVSAG
jgi:3',5'-cyclic-AMP phosphodiesterase